MTKSCLLRQILVSNGGDDVPAVLYASRQWRSSSGDRRSGLKRLLTNSGPENIWPPQILPHQPVCTAVNPYGQSVRDRSSLYAAN
ncbi:hypothetical protein FH972_015407 [Carpinus fangiana]|uniref:Uncharacterized protein n=1 Tax=Carpinus fangiana TaxID=176857 RepID=A0A5N6RG20_9ROSI|nr:hypothetical protein FH972_015407 [Carpinus fangiana]